MPHYHLSSKSKDLEFATLAAARAALDYELRNVRVLHVVERPGRLIVTGRNPSLQTKVFTLKSCARTRCSGHTSLPPSFDPGLLDDRPYREVEPVFHEHALARAIRPSFKLMDVLMAGIRHPDEELGSRKSRRKIWTWILGGGDEAEVTRAALESLAKGGDIMLHIRPCRASHCRASYLKWWQS